jgi:hypothetical protein
MQVQCPVYILHGQLDEEVHWHHGLRLHEATPAQHKRQPWWVSDGGHNDICEGSDKLDEYYRRLRVFIAELNSVSSSSSTANTAGAVGAGSSSSKRSGNSSSSAKQQQLDPIVSIA